MTTRRLNQLNRRTRIVRAAIMGEPYAAIAQREGVSWRQVSRIALQEGVQRRGSEQWSENVRRGKADGVGV